MPEPTQRTKRDDIDLRVVVWATVVLCGIVAISAAVAYVAWRGAASTPRQLAPNESVQVRVAGVALQSAPHSDRAAYEAEKQHLLHSYAWVDADAGVARIPIDVAMRVLAQRDTERLSAGAKTKPAEPAR